MKIVVTALFIAMSHGSSTFANDTAQSALLSDTPRQIKRADTDGCLSILNAAAGEWTELYIDDCSGEPHQQWVFHYVGQGRYAVKNFASGSCFDLAGGSSSLGSKIYSHPCYEQENQYWKFNQLENNRYTIESMHPGLCFDIPYPGRTAHLVECFGNQNQIFEIH